jgi:pimeloyl-ACP methyl ester carboxylesterase
MRGKPARLATIRRDGGWFGAAGRAPDLAIDLDVITEDDLETYSAALQRNGFFGPNSWYMNHARNHAYALKARDGGRLSLPVLFLHAELDFTCETIHSRLAEPMRRDCSRLTEGTVRSGHWMAQEQPIKVNAALARWLARELPAYWPA